jgi:hypothetical protein
LVASIATFVRLAVRQVDLRLAEESSIVILSMLQGASVGVSTLAGQSYYSAFAASVPDLQVKILRSITTASDSLCEVGSVEGSIEFDAYATPRGWKDKAAGQHDFLDEQDKATSRLGLLYEKSAGRPSQRGEWRALEAT